MHTHTFGQDMLLSNGKLYSMPLTTAAAALRLDIHNALPAADGMLTNHHPTNLQLLLNLWMCADKNNLLKGVFVRIVIPAVLQQVEHNLAKKRREKLFCFF